MVVIMAITLRMILTECESVVPLHRGYGPWVRKTAGVTGVGFGEAEHHCKGRLCLCLAQVQKRQRIGTGVQSKRNKSNLLHNAAAAPLPQSTNCVWHACSQPALSSALEYPTAIAAVREGESRRCLRGNRSGRHF